MANQFFSYIRRVTRNRKWTVLAMFRYAMANTHVVCKPLGKARATVLKPTAEVVKQLFQRYSKKDLPEQAPAIFEHLPVCKTKSQRCCCHPSVRFQLLVITFLWALFLHFEVFEKHFREKFTNFLFIIVVGSWKIFAALLPKMQSLSLQRKLQNLPFGEPTQNSGTAVNN